MIFKATPLQGAFLIEPERILDERGFFARSFCVKEFEAHGLDPRVVQCNISYNKNKGTLRGMHYQLPPFEEAKLIRCTAGAIYDVIIDLKKESPTRLKHFGIRLDSKNRLMLFAPEGFAHGYMTLEDHTEVFYQMSEFYSADRAMGIRWNDPFFSISWPLQVSTISEKDRLYPDFQ
jgi:dTDP-4-dehydrorhamnose 3,5-epimerase